MGNQSSSKHSQPNAQHNPSGISKMTLPEHTIKSGITPRKSPLHLQLASPINFQESQLNTLTAHEQYQEQPQQKFYESPYSMMRTTNNKKMADETFDQQNSALNQSYDSVRQTHLNQNTKKSTLGHKNKPTQIQSSKSMVHSVNKRLNNQRPVSRSAVNAQTNVLSSDGTVILKQPQSGAGLLQKAQYSFLKVPSHIDDIETIKLSDKSQSRQLQKSFEGQRNKLDYSQRTTNEILEKDYDERGYFILTDTKIGQKNSNQTTANPQDSQHSSPYRESISEWIASKFCGIDETEEDPKNAFNCNLFAKLKKPNMMARQKQDDYELPNQYTEKRLSILDQN